MCWGPRRTWQEQCDGVPMFIKTIYIYTNLFHFSGCILDERTVRTWSFSVPGCCPGRNAQSIPSLIGINHNSQQLSDCWRLGPLDSYMADVPLDQQEDLYMSDWEHFSWTLSVLNMCGPAIKKHNGVIEIWEKIHIVINNYAGQGVCSVLSSGCV